MEQIRYTVILDITDNGCFNTGWRLKQGDGQNIVLNVKVTNNGDNYVAENPPRIVFKRPDGYSVIGQMDALDDDFYTYTIVGNEIAVAGNVVMDVKFGADNDRTSTASCKFEVIPDTIGQSSGGSDVYDNTVAELVEISKANVILAESYTKGGTGSRSGEDTDNAKYYKEQAAEIVGPLTQKVNGVIEDLTQIYDDGFASKNILKTNVKTQTINGVTFTVNDDGTVLVNGTASANILYYLEDGIKYPSGTYKIAGCPSGGGRYLIGIRKNNIWTTPNDSGNGAEVTVTDTDVLRLQIYVDSGTVCNNLLFKPILSKDLSVTYNDYQPYIPSNIELKENLTPKSYSASGLTYTNCSYVAGGYCKVGNLAIINMRVTASNPTFNISGFPAYNNLISVNSVALNVFDASSNSTTSEPTGMVESSGKITVVKATSNYIYFVSAMYICN